MLDTGRLPPFFASPYSRSRLTNASANGLPRGFLGEPGVNGSSDSDDLSSPPPNCLGGSAATHSSGSAAGPRRPQRRPRGAGASPPGTGAAATAVSPDLGSAASAMEALLSLKNPRESLLTRLPRETDLFQDAASLQLLALGGSQQQQQHQHQHASSASSKAVAGGCAAPSLTSRPQTALNLAALSLLSAGYPLNGDDQTQQQGPAKSSALLQQMANLDSSAALLKLLDHAGAAVNADQHLHQPGSAARSAQRPGAQQVQWEPESVDAQLLGMALKPLLARGSHEAAQGSTPGPSLQGMSSHDTTSPLCSLDCASMELNNFGVEQAAAADAAPQRDAADSFSLRESASKSATRALTKERDLLLDFLTTADQAQRQLQHQQRLPQEDVLGTLNSLVSLLQSIRRQDPAKQSLPAAAQLLSSLANSQTSFAQQQQLLREHSSGELRHQQAARSPNNSVGAEPWRAASSSGGAEALEKDQAFSASLLRFLQGQPGCDEVTGDPAAVLSSLAATRTPEPHGASEERADAPFPHDSKTGIVTSRSTSASSCFNSSIIKTEGMPTTTAPTSKASRRPSDASCPTSDSVGVSSPPCPAPAYSAEEEDGEATNERQERGLATEFSFCSEELKTHHPNAGTGVNKKRAGKSSCPAELDFGLGEVL